MLIKFKPVIVEGETRFRRTKADRMDLRGKPLHLDRIFASGGFVVTEWENHSTGKHEMKYMTPAQAYERFKALQDGGQLEDMPVNFREGFIKAYNAAKNQTVEGHNVAFNVDDYDSTKILSDMEQERKNDPELDKELKEVETLWMEILVTVKKEFGASGLPKEQIMGMAQQRFEMEMARRELNKV